MSHFDRIIAAVVLAFAMVAGALTVTSARLGPSIDSLATAQMLGGTSVNTQIGITFTEPMNIRSVERSFTLIPRVHGSFSWSGNEMIFLPGHALEYDRSYTVTVGATARDRTGKRMLRPYHASFTTEAQHLIYRGASGPDNNRLVLASVTGQRRIVGPDDGTVIDFSLSYDRTTVVFAKRGVPGQRPNEIWLLSLADGSMQRVLRRPTWTITQPHFSPDGRYIVFLATNVRVCQKYYGCYRDRSSPIIYLLDLQTHRIFPFHSASAPITNFIDFSPAGYLAYTDLGSALTLAKPNGSGVLHVPNAGNSLEFAGFDALGDKAAFVGQTPSSTGGDVLVYLHGKYIDVSHGVYDSASPAFSDTGTRIAYAAYRGELGIQPVYGINIYDFKTRTTVKLTRDRVWSDWSPNWSPGDRYLAFVRSRPEEAMYMGSGQIWAIRSGGSMARAVGGIGTNPQWVA
jgi:Tol biopolymer transport system component